MSLDEHLYPERAVDGIRSIPVKKRLAPEKAHAEEIFNEAVREYDIAVHIPPKRRYSIELDVKRTSNAEPKIVEPKSI